jgi:plasmid maintenance system antidote protein VapI
MHLDHEAQRRAIDRLQRRLWVVVVETLHRRQHLGLTQSELARTLRISPPQISVWLNDPNAMTLRAAARLRLAMDTEIELPAGGQKKPDLV